MNKAIMPPLQSGPLSARRGSVTFLKALLLGSALLLLAPGLIIAGPGDPVMEARFGRSNAVLLAQDGHALHDVVIGHEASRRTRNAAEDLVRYLDLITGAKFQLTTGDGSSGIAVGSWDDFASLNLENLFRLDDPARADDHIVKTHGAGVYLIGASDLAAQHAVWTLLYEIGYRQFFPTKTWEIVPEKPTLRVQIRSFEKPDFVTRGGPRATSWSDDDLWDAWIDRNRLRSSYSLSTSHAYGGIIRRNQAEFDANPEYLAKVNGVFGGGRGDKFRISNENLRKLVIQDAVDRFHSNPDRMSISMDPSDGGDWCETEEEQEFGSVTDRVVILANEVAEAVNKLGYGEKYVGIYAYNQHSPPPSVDVHPNVVVSIATEFIRGPFTVSELIDGWAERASILGIRDYYDTFVWSQGMPRRGRGGNVNWLKETLPYYHEKGARFMHANSTDSWAVNGLGYYVSSHLLWDVSTDAEKIVDDFLEKAFAEAQEPMRRFYEIVGRGRDMPRTDSDLLANMYGYLYEAYNLTDDPKIIARLNYLSLYTRYAELYLAFKESNRRSDLEEAFGIAYRMKSIMLSPVHQLYRHHRSQYGIPSQGGSYRVGEKLNNNPPWENDKPFTQDEIESYVINGIKNYEKDEVDFKIVEYSENLVPAIDYLDLPRVRTGSMGRGSRGRNVFWTWLEEDQPLKLSVTGGTISHYQDRGNVRFNLYSPKEALVEPVDTDESVPPDEQTYEISLVSPYSGLHTMEMDDGNDRTWIEWEEGHPMTLRSSLTDAFRFQRNFELYFYVPKGTEVVGGYMDRHDHTTFYDGDGNEMKGWKNTEEHEGYFNIPVPEGQDGTLWKIECKRGAVLRMMTVPPYFARNERELLLPIELFKEDNKENEPEDDDPDDKSHEIPTNYEIHQNFPNPFNPKTIINYALPEQSHVRLEVFNIIGQRVVTLLNEVKDAGLHQVAFDGSGLASGMYLYRIQTDSFVESKQMLLVK